MVSTNTIANMMNFSRDTSGEGNIIAVPSPRCFMQEPQHHLAKYFYQCWIVKDSDRDCHTAQVFCLCTTILRQLTQTIPDTLATLIAVPSNDETRQSMVCIMCARLNDRAGSAHQVVLDRVKAAPT
ncbi:unnamed protein product [Caenorhabditis brenneri]